MSDSSATKLGSDTGNSTAGVLRCPECGSTTIRADPKNNCVTCGSGHMIDVFYIYDAAFPIVRTTAAPTPLPNADGKEPK
jgi:hypothetical protein